MNSKNGIINVKFNDLSLITSSFKQAADYIISCCLSKGSESNILVHINVYNYYILRKYPDFKRDITNNCTLIMDGIGLKLGCYFLNNRWLPDLNGTDLFPIVMNMASKLRLKVYLVGAKPECIQLAVNNIGVKYPGIQLVGFHSGYFMDHEEDEIVGEINDSECHLLIIGRGFKKQEGFALKYRNKLNVNLIWNVGGLFDFVSGKKTRASIFWRKYRIEWLFRFIIEPKRMYYRNIINLLWFPMHLIKLKILKDAD